MATRIGGVVVARGSRIYWGTLFSILAGSAVYAWFEGIIGLLQTVGDGFRSGLDSVGAFVGTVIRLEFTLAGVATRSAWAEFWTFGRGAGPFSWLLSVLVFALVLTVLLVILQTGVRRLAG